MARIRTGIGKLQDKPGAPCGTNKLSYAQIVFSEATVMQRHQEDKSSQKELPEATCALIGSTK